MKTVLILIVLSTQAFNANAITTVGTDQSCDFDNIQDAVDSINSGDIFITNQKVYRENISIHSKAIDLSGGFANCDDANNVVHNGGITTISGDTDNNGTGDDTVIQLTGSNDVDLNFLKIEDGHSFTHAGGIDIQKTNGYVNLSSVTVTNNYGHSGGGIKLYNSPNTFLRLFRNVNIVSNTANFFGGGLYCDGSGSMVQSSSAVSYENGVSNNTANLNGGGVYLSNNCGMQFKSGRLESGFLDFRGIAGNQAKLNGGGVYISSGASLILEPAVGRTVNISENTADSDNNDTGNGGGVFITGSNSVFYGANSHITANSAYYGGGIYATGGAGVLWGSTSQGCVDKNRCANIKSNTAKVRGGGLYANGTNTQLEFVKTYFEFNRADVATGVYVDNEASVTTDYSIFSRNGANGAGNYLDNGIFHVHNDASLTLRQTTVVDNNAEIAVIVTDMTPFDIDIWNSIIHDPDSGFVVDLSQQQSSDLLAWNVLFHEDSGLYGNSVIVDDPLFEDRESGNFNLSSASPAIDEAFELVDHYPTDYKGAATGWDDPDTIGSGGTYDLGAFESYASDIIFKNGIDD